MKISELIDEVCLEAETKFGVDKHTNDTISIYIYASGEDWQVGLQRPTQRQLDSGEISEDKLHTIKKYEYLTGFFTRAPTLVEALQYLADRVSVANEWEQ